MEPTHFTLSTGAPIPRVGVGCWMGRVGEGPHVVEMVRTALRIGYRHIDTSVGIAIRESGIPREEIFLTTKLTSEDHGRVAEAMHQSLEKLGVTYPYLYSPTIAETWRDMEQLMRAGKTKAIGVSNFSVKLLTTLLEHAEITPSVNQHALLQFCRSRGILLTAYTPLGKGKDVLTADEDVVRIAQREGITSAQVLLSWGVQRGTCVIPKSMSEDRLALNLQLHLLKEEDMNDLNNLHGKPGKHRSMCGFHSPALGGSCFGWTYEQLCWDMTAGGIVPQNLE
ncbi:NADP-dependent oxidoreductase domain-containing protein [Infundibulicybe gibba]|nr:NADP-dependent oxidoreductase domain-containing protein [Infundibulicybe gibba]